MTDSLIAPLGRARFIVTLPPEPSLVGAELQRLAGASFTTLTATNDAFQHLAQKAESRIVIMTPYIDAAGAIWATEIFNASRASKRILILKDSSELNKFGVYGETLRQAATKIFDYTIEHANNDSRYNETFHAKVVLADGVAAYVGSANFLYRSKEVNLECGFLLEGDAVAPIAVLVEAVLSIFTNAEK